MLQTFRCIFAFVVPLLTIAQAQTPKPIGKMVDLGGYKVHVHCTGKGSPTVVIENGFDEFSFDWILVQNEVQKFARVCTYDRAGYAWSTPGPLPRTYTQINLDLHSALKKLGEKGPYILVGHSFGGPVIRNYALLYRREVRALIFAEAIGDAHRITMGKKTARIADFAQKRDIPEPHDTITSTDQPKVAADATQVQKPSIDPPFDRLPIELQRAHVWALSQPSLATTESSERDWSPEYLAKWIASDQTGTLGDLPIIVLARKEGGYGNGDDLSAEELERLRREEHEQLAALSSRGKVIWVDGGHEIELENPEAVIKAVRELTQH